MPRHASRSVCAFVAVTLSVAISGCSVILKPAQVPTVTYEPAFADVIDSITPIGGDILEFQLASGGSYAYDRGTALSDVVPAEHTPFYRHRAETRP